MKKIFLFILTLISINLKLSAQTVTPCGELHGVDKIQFTNGKPLIDVEILLSKFGGKNAVGQGYRGVLTNTSNEKVHVIGLLYANLKCGNQSKSGFDLELAPHETNAGSIGYLVDVTGLNAVAGFDECEGEKGEVIKAGDDICGYKIINSVGIEFSLIEIVKEHNDTAKRNQSESVIKKNQDEEAVIQENKKVEELRKLEVEKAANQNRDQALEIQKSRDLEIQANRNTQLEQRKSLIGLMNSVDSYHDDNITDYSFSGEFNFGMQMLSANLVSNLMSSDYYGNLPKLSTDTKGRTLEGFNLGISLNTFSSNHFGVSFPIYGFYAYDVSSTNDALGLQYGIKTYAGFTRLKFVYQFRYNIGHVSGIYDHNNSYTKDQRFEGGGYKSSNHYIGIRIENNKTRQMDLLYCIGGNFNNKDNLKKTLNVGNGIAFCEYFYSIGVKWIAEFYWNSPAIGSPMWSSAQVPSDWAPKGFMLNIGICKNLWKGFKEKN